MLPLVRRTSAQIRIDAERRSVPQRLGSLDYMMEEDARPVVRVHYDDALWRDATRGCEHTVYNPRSAIRVRPNGDRVAVAPSDAQIDAAKSAVFGVSRAVDVEPPPTTSDVGQTILSLTRLVEGVEAVYVLGKLREGTTLLEGTLKWPCEHALRSCVVPVFLYNLTTDQWMRRDARAWVDIPAPPSVRTFRSVACLGATLQKLTPNARAAVWKLTNDLR